MVVRGDSPETGVRVLAPSLFPGWWLARDDDRVLLFDCLGGAMLLYRRMECAPAAFVGTCPGSLTVGMGDFFVFCVPDGVLFVVIRMADGFGAVPVRLCLRCAMYAGWGDVCCGPDGGWIR